jgi:uncharacterized protein (TIGR03118 family)
MLNSKFISYFRDISDSLRKVSPSFSSVTGKNWFRAVSVGTLSAILSIGTLAQTSSTYVQTNIISDGGPGSVAAQVTDPTLINPWGVSVGPAIWIDKVGSGSVAIDTAAGAIAVPSLPSVTIPAAASTTAQGSPSGTVYNSAGTGFNLPGSTSAASFLFGTLDGTIAAWNVASGTQAVTVVNNSAKASYTDIALDTNATGTFLLAANFEQGTVDVFDSTFAAHALMGSFADPTLPTGYSPFGIHSIGGNVYVTYAHNPTTGESVGAGLGYVNEFDNNGNFIVRVVSQSVLNAPWGMALAPVGFGSFAGDLLIGNFGDGVINAFDPKTFALIGSLNASAGTPIANIGLWEIFFGQNSGQTTTLGDPNTLYFSAGINGEKGGLFGSIAVAQPAAANFTFQASANSVTVAAGQTTGSLTLSLAATNGFNGPVTFSCMPASVACTFSPPSVMLSGSGTTSVAVAIAPVVTTAPPPPPPTGYNIQATHHSVHLFPSRTGFTLAFIGPAGLLAFAGLKRRSILAGGSLFALLLLVTTAAIAGCSSSTTPQQASTTPAAPAAIPVTVNAVSGSITQSVMVTFTAE